MSQIITVDFQGDVIFAVEREGAPFVAVKPISDRLGLSWVNQLRRINRDPILAEGVAIMAIPSLGGVQETTCLQLDLINGWLFGIDHDRVKPELRERVLAYKRSCYAALFAYFHPTPAAQEVVEREATESEASKLAAVREARLVFGYRAAQQMWFSKGLPTVPAMFVPNVQPELFDSEAA